MEPALLFCRENYTGLQVMLTAQAHLVPFYRSFGFEPTGEPYDDFGLTHVDMELRSRDSSRTAWPAEDPHWPRRDLQWRSLVGHTGSAQAGEIGGLDHGTEL